jgi:hypothetical protein
VKAPWPDGGVLPMRDERSRFQHVVKHLYQPRERWEQVVTCGGARARAEAWAAGCAPAVLDRRHPDPADCAPACVQHVLDDHDRHLQPAYLAAIESGVAAARVRALPKAPGRGLGWLIVGDLGVSVVVRLVRRRDAEVKTAYRVVPRGRGRRPEDFRYAAVLKLRDKSSYKGGD